jgi:hypothetical protein
MVSRASGQHTEVSLETGAKGRQTWKKEVAQCTRAITTRRSGNVSHL